MPDTTTDQAAQLAHALNNVLAVIGGHADSLEGAIAPESDDARSLRAIQDAVRSGAALVEQVRTLSRPHPTASRGTDVRRAIDAAVTDATRVWGHRLAVAADAAPDTWSASLPAGILERALWHVVERAADAVPHGATIAIRTMNLEVALPGSASRRHVRVEVSAPAMPPWLASAAGADLRGAAALQALADAGGRISEETDGAYAATWALLLPSDGVPPLRPAPGRENGAVVTVVDPEPARRRVVLTLLARQGYDARAAASPAAAAEALRNGDADVVVSDLAALDDETAMALHACAPKVVWIVGAQTPVAPHVAASTLRAPFSGEQLLTQVRAALDAAALASVVPVHEGIV